MPQRGLIGRSENGLYHRDVRDPLNRRIGKHGSKLWDYWERVKRTEYRDQEMTQLVNEEKETAICIFCETDRCRDLGTMANHTVQCQNANQTAKTRASQLLALKKRKQSSRKRRLSAANNESNDLRPQNVHHQSLLSKLPSLDDSNDSNDSNRQQRRRLKPIGAGIAV